MLGRIKIQKRTSTAIKPKATKLAVPAADDSPKYVLLTDNWSKTAISISVAAAYVAKPEDRLAIAVIIVLIPSGRKIRLTKQSIISMVVAIVRILVPVVNSYSGMTLFS